MWVDRVLLEVTMDRDRVAVRQVTPAHRLALWREAGQWRLRHGHSTYWGTLRGALGYGWRSWRLR